MSDHNPIADQDRAPSDRDPLFAARLTPHRSLSKNGFIALMLIIAVMAGSSAFVFLTLGAWPIVGFLMADVAIIFLAFQISYRAGRAYEEVTVTPDQLTIKRVSPWGRISVQKLHPVWTRLKTAYDPEEERVLAIKLESKGQQVPVGAFMNPADKESFANALGEALARAKRGAPA